MTNYQTKKLNKYYKTRSKQIDSLKDILFCTCTPYEKKNGLIEKKISEQLGLTDLFLTQQDDKEIAGRKGNRRQMLNLLKAQLIKNENKIKRTPTFKKK